MKSYGKVALLQISNFTSGLGNSIVVITIPWLILERTDSPAFAGLVVAISALPGLLISPIGGWMVDHLGRRKVSIGADLLSSLSVIAFPIVSMTIGLSSPTILIIALIGAIFDPAGYTARRTLLVDVAESSGVEQDRLNGIHDGFLGVAWIVGPAVGAWLITAVGSVNSFWVASGLFLVAALSIALLRVSDLGKMAREEAQSSSGDSERSFTIGMRTLWRDRLLRTMTIAVLIIAAVYLPTESVLLPTYFEANDDPSGLGLVISALAAGAALSAFGYGWLSARFERRALVRTILVGVAASIIPMAFLPALPILILAGFFLGFSWGPFNPLISTLIQERVPAHQQGRVFGAQTAVFYAAPPLGMVASGLSVERFGIAPTYAVLAFILSATALLTLLAKSLREEF